MKLTPGAPGWLGELPLWAFGIPRTTKVPFRTSYFACLLRYEQINADPYPKWAARRVAGASAP